MSHSFWVFLLCLLFITTGCVYKGYYRLIGRKYEIGKAHGPVAVYTTRHNDVTIESSAISGSWGLFRIDLCLTNNGAEVCSFDASTARIFDQLGEPPGQALIIDGVTCSSDCRIRLEPLSACRIAVGADLRRASDKRYSDTVWVRLGPCVTLSGDTLVFPDTLTWTLIRGSEEWPH